MQVTLFAWLNAKIEKTSTKDKFENNGFFAQYYITVFCNFACNITVFCNKKCYKIL